MAHRGGEEIPGATVERTFQVDGEGLCVHERVLGSKGVRGLDYRLPALARDVEHSRGEWSYRLA